MDFSKQETIEAALNSDPACLGDWLRVVSIYHNNYMSNRGGWGYQIIPAFPRKNPIFHQSV